MIEIYFDNVLLDSDNYKAFNITKQTFNNEFYLGSTASVQASLIIPKDALPSTLENVKIKIDNSDFLHLVVDSITINDDEEAEIKLTDKMINLGVKYDISELVPITAKNLLNQICTDFNISHDTFSFINEDVEIASYDSNLTARDYVSMITELAGGYAQINNQGKLVIKYYSNENITNKITSEDVDNYKLNNEITIERVVYEFGLIKKETDNDENKYTLYLNPDNLFLQVITDEEFEALCDNIIGFKFNNINIPTCNLVFSNQDLITFVDIENNEHTILNEFNAEYFGGFISSYKYEINNTKEEITKIENNVQKINRIRFKIDQTNASIEEITETISGEDGLESKINSVVARQTDTERTIEIISTNINTENGEIQSVKTTTGYTFDKDGLKIQQEGQTYNSLFNNTGSYYKDGDNILSQTTVDGTVTKDLTIYGSYYYGVDEGQQFDKKEAMFIGMKSVDENQEEFFGHYYNGE